jgi:2-polyprenyl-3-methyl-5-hydroxy-6-metoxy-1,4-benzoquinol methylase
MDLKEQDILGDAVESHWYYRSKADALVSLLSRLTPRRILDVGAGSGFFSRQLLARTPATEALCVDTGYEHDRDELSSGKPLRFRRECARTVDADCMLMMDVLEHVPDDKGLLVDYARRLPPGAVIVVTVPAFTFLWSGHDVYLGHERRYTLGQVEEVARGAGLEILTGAYLFAMVFPLAVARRLVGPAARRVPPRSELSRHSSPANFVLRAACAFELPWFRFNRLAGLTACCVARTPSRTP